MACSCGGGGESDYSLFLLTHNLLPNLALQSQTLSSSSSSSSSTVISPMNFNFCSASMPHDILRSILDLARALTAPPPDLARAACVCRLWRSVASDRDMLEHAFKKPWNVHRVVGIPSSIAFWRHPALDRFAISHHLRRGDTVAGLALKYSVQVVDIKRLNNMMSEHGIYSRERLLIPVSSSKPELLSNSTCYIELDAHAKREVAIVYLNEEGRPLVSAPGDTTTTTTSSTTAASELRGRSRILVESVKRSMHIDDGTAQYYLSVSNGDPRPAILHLSEDLSWEQQREGCCTTDSSIII